MNFSQQVILNNKNNMLKKKEYASIQNLNNNFIDPNINRLSMPL